MVYQNIDSYCRGFAVKASAKILDKVNMLSKDFSPTIEEDSIVTASS